MESAREAGFMLLFRYPRYGRLWLGRVVSGFGDQAGWIALVWYLLHRTNHPSSVGWVTLLYMLPSVFVSPVAGVLLDRFPRARVMAVGNALLAVLFGFMVAASYQVGSSWLYVFYTLIGLAGVILPLNSTGGGTLLPELIPQEHLTQANYLMQMEWQVGLVLGPALGAVLISLVGSQWVLHGDAATFLLVAAVLLSIPRGPVRNQSQTVWTWHYFSEGLRFLRHSRTLIAVTTVSVLFNFLYGPYEVIVPVLARNRFHSPGAMGLWWGLFAVGSVLGSLGLSLRDWPVSKSLTLATIVGVWGLVTIAMGFSPNLWETGALMFIGGLSYAPWGGLVMSVYQRLVPDEKLGRVLAVSQSLAIAGMPLGAWVGGVILGHVAVATVFFISGGCTVAIGIISYVWPSFRAVDSAERVA